VIGVIAEKYAIQIHAICVLSNHYHLTHTDPYGLIVEFERDANSFISRAINCAHGDFESMWSRSPSSRVECLEPADLVGKIAYTMANPVAARLVKFGRNWPGLRRAWPSKSRVIKRPAKFFRGPDAGGRWPDQVSLELSRPPGYDEYSDDELAAVLDAAIDRDEEKEREQAKEQSESFVGRKGVLSQSRYNRPRSHDSRFKVSPDVAAKDKWLRIERLSAKPEWLRSYRVARLRWIGGERDVEFPYGTYKLRVEFGVCCAPPPH